MDTQNGEKKILWYSLAFMAFSTVWGFGNVINGFSEYGGLKAIVSWILIFAIYFVPYALMVGELGSAFKRAGGGVSSWIYETIGPRMAYYAGWTYWVVHMPYICLLYTSIAFLEDLTGQKFNWDTLRAACERHNLQTQYEMNKWETNMTDCPQFTGSVLWLFRMFTAVGGAPKDPRYVPVEQKVDAMIKRAHKRKESNVRKERRHRAVIWLSLIHILPIRWRPS